MADPADVRERAASFAGVADAYERARPGYPDDAVRWLAGVRPCEVVDLGAGTGKLTRALVALGHRVVAVEPLEAMLAHLRAVVPEADAVLGSAESIPLVDASADVVTVAQAFHWFDQESALAEIARVLRPGGRLALVWNTRDDHQAWVPELSRIIGSECSHDWGLDRFLSLGGSFGQAEKATFSFVQRIDRSTLADLVLSRSYCAVLSEEDRRPVIAAVDALFDERSEGGVIALPYVTVCFRAARR